MQKSISSLISLSSFVSSVYTKSLEKYFLFFRDLQVLLKASRVEAASLQLCSKRLLLPKEFQDVCSMAPVATEKMGSDDLPVSFVPSNSSGIGWCGSQTTSTPPLPPVCVDRY